MKETENLINLEVKAIGKMGRRVKEMENKKREPFCNRTPSSSSPFPLCLAAVDRTPFCSPQKNG